MGVGAGQRSGACCHAHVNPVKTNQLDKETARRTDVKQDYRREASRCHTCEIAIVSLLQEWQRAPGGSFHGFRKIPLTGVTVTAQGRYWEYCRLQNKRPAFKFPSYPSLVE